MKDQLSFGKMVTFLLVIT